MRFHAPFLFCMGIPLKHQQQQQQRGYGHWIGQHKCWLLPADIYTTELFWPGRHLCVGYFKIGKYFPMHYPFVITESD